MAPSDPRLGLQSTVNGRILDGMVRHAIGLRRVAGGETKRILTFLDDEVFPEIHGLALSRIDRIRARGLETDFTQERYKAMLAGIRHLITGGIGDASTMAQDAMKELAPHEAQHVAGLIQGASPVTLEVAIPLPSRLRQIVTGTPVIQGETIPQAFKTLSRATQAKVEREIKVGLIAGEGAEAIVRRLRGKGGVADQSRAALRSLVSTAATGVGAASRQALYAENEDILNGWQFVATLDGRTTLICITHDGKVYKVGDTRFVPPLHFGCRSADVPVTKSWRQLGVDRDEIGAGERAAMDGRAPGAITYPEWLKQQPVAFQDGVLGKGRAQLWRRGEIAIDRFVDQKGRSLAVKELIRLEARAEMGA